MGDVVRAVDEIERLGREVEWLRGEIGRIRSEQRDAENQVLRGGYEGRVSDGGGDPLHAGSIRVVGHEWQQWERGGLDPYRWRVTFELELVNGWGIEHALAEVRKYIESGRGR